MRVAEAESRLWEMLVASGLGSKATESGSVARVAWETFKAFAAEPVDEARDHPDDDMLLFEFSGARWEDGSGNFALELVRQFSLTTGEGEYDHMEHLRLQISCELTPELEAPGSGSGHFLPAATHLEMWISDVEQSPAFTALMTAPWSRIGLEQEHV